MPPHKIHLPIVTPEEVRADTVARKRSASERFGGFYGLSLAGLAILVGLIAWFAWGVWSMRDVWSNIYTLNDRSRPERDRIIAAHALSRDPRVTPRQRWDLCLSRVPVTLARYLLAESLDQRALDPDPSAFALSIARSEGWPDWLRLLLVRPLAYGAGTRPLPSAPLDELRRHPDRAIQLWTAYAQAAGRDDPEARQTLHQEAEDASSTFQILAQHLLQALHEDATTGLRSRALDEATLWLRDHHPEARRIWQGWVERDGHLTYEDFVR